jgi:hypothetical protein
LFEIVLGLELTAIKRGRCRPAALGDSVPIRKDERGGGKFGRRPLTALEMLKFDSVFLK